MYIYEQEENSSITRRIILPSSYINIITIFLEKVNFLQLAFQLLQPRALATNLCEKLSELNDL